MKKIIIALNLILLLAFCAIAQKHKQTPEVVEKDSPQPNGKKSSGNAADSMDKVLLESGTNLDAKLLSTLDVKKAEVGDEVVLKTTQSIKQNGEVIIPKGTKLIGRITEVQRKTKENKTSKISMIFESLQNKDLALPLNASIVSISNVSSNLRGGDSLGADVTGSSRSSSTASSGSSSGGGLLGGVTNTVGGVTNTVGNTVGGTTNTLGRTVNGIQITKSVDATAQGSSTLSAQNKDVRIEKGATFQLQLNQSISN